MTNLITDEMLASYMEAVKATCDAYFERMGFTYEKLRQTITAEPGRRYIRIVKADADGTSRSVHSFLDKTTGNILKAESWKKPAKHARGNLLVEGWEGSFGPHGANYL